MKNKDNHARTHEKQRTTMQKPMKHHEKTKEKPCKNQWKPRRNNENKCVHHTYPTFMYHLYSMSKWYIWFYFSQSDNTFIMCIDTLYMLPVRRRTRGTEEIEEMRKQEDEETKRRRKKSTLNGDCFYSVGLLRGSRVIFFFDPPWRRGFQLLSQVRDDFVCAIFFLMLLIFSFWSPPNIFFWSS